MPGRIDTSIPVNTGVVFFIFGEYVAVRIQTQHMMKSCRSRHHHHHQPHRQRQLRCDGDHQGFVLRSQQQQQQQQQRPSLWIACLLSATTVLTCSSFVPFLFLFSLPSCHAFSHGSTNNAIVSRPPPPTTTTRRSFTTTPTWTRKEMLPSYSSTFHHCPMLLPFSLTNNNNNIIATTRTTTAPKRMNCKYKQQGVDVLRHPPFSSSSTLLSMTIEKDSENNNDSEIGDLKNNREPSNLGEYLLPYALAALGSLVLTALIFKFVLL